MEIKQQYVQPYLHEITINQLSADYKAKGYEVSEQDTIGGYHADLVARKGGEVIVFDVQAGKPTYDKRQQIIGIGDYVRTHKNHKFLVVLATPPKPKKISVPNLDQLLHDYLVNNFPDKLRALSPHTRITGVVNIVVNELIVKEKGGMNVRGSGIINVELDYGPADGGVSDDVFPFVFDATLTYDENRKTYRVDTASSEIDTSSFYD